MSQLSDLLELLHAGNSRYTTFAASYSCWERPGVKWRAVMRTLAVEPREARLGRTRQLSGTFFGGPSDDGPPESGEESGSFMIAVERPDRFREEIHSGEEVGLLIRDGVSWWSYDAHMGVSTNADDAEPRMSRARGEYEALGDPSVFPGLLELEPLGSGERAGRRVLRARARPRAAGVEGDRYTVAAAIGGIGADEYALEFDAERAVVLYAEAMLTGSAFSIVEAKTVAFDEPLAAETFVFVSPPD